ncbi:aspartyl/asparaginyl beta-hydroxylase-like [Tigriopus californicus]|nr:aspartyl/asparaginyl beta-hydroxylase-like [Tigriopus californicus]
MNSVKSCRKGETIKPRKGHYYPWEKKLVKCAKFVCYTLTDIVKRCNFRMRVFIPCIVISLAFALAKGDDGLCSAEGPSPDGTCTGAGKEITEKKVHDQVLTYAYEEKPMNESEAEVWARRFYSKLAYTNDYDWSIRHLLDDADDYIVNEPSQAMAKFEAILDKYPQSARAFYSLTRTMEFLNKTDMTDEEKKAIDVKVIHNYKDMLQRKDGDIARTMLGSCIHQGLLYAINKNRTEDKLALLELGFKRKHIFENDRFHELYVEELVISEYFDRAEKALAVALEEFPRNQFFKFMKGILLKYQGQKKEASILLRDVEFAQNEVYGVASDLVSMALELHKRGKAPMADVLYQEASKAHIFLSKYQRPYDTILDLDSKPIWSMDDVQVTAYDEEFTLLKESWETIRGEALEIRKNGSLWISTSGQEWIARGTTLQFPIFTWGKKRSYHCTLVPKTCQIFKTFTASSKFPKGHVRFEVISNKTHLFPHSGPTNARLRGHLGLQVPEGFKMRIAKGNYLPEKEGTITLFEDSYEYEIWNESDDEMIVLSFDMPHPDITYQQSKQAFNSNIRYTFNYL